MSTLFQRFKRSAFSVALATALLSGGAIAAGAALGTTPPALAQDQPNAAPPEGHHGNRMGQMLMSLNLSDTQKAQIRAIVADAHKQNKDVTDRDVRRANMKAAISKIDTVLTPAQRTEWHAKLDAARQGAPPIA